MLIYFPVSTRVSVTNPFYWHHGLQGCQEAVEAMLPFSKLIAMKKH